MVLDIIHIRFFLIVVQATGLIGSEIYYIAHRSINNYVYSYVIIFEFISDDRMMDLSSLDNHCHAF